MAKAIPHSIVWEAVSGFKFVKVEAFFSSRRAAKKVFNTMELDPKKYAIVKTEAKNA